MTCLAAILAFLGYASMKDGDRPTGRFLVGAAIALIVGDAILAAVR